MASAVANVSCTARTCRYASGTRTTNCTTCPVGSTTSQRGATTIDDCRCDPVGYYRTANAQCGICDANDPTAVCVTYNDKNEQVLAPGWWISDAQSTTSTSASHGSGGSNSSTSLGIPKPLRCPVRASTVCRGGATVGECAVGYEGNCRRGVMA